ncbi:MAG: DUF3618 domain-containing protein [Dermatophilaceae bacterium]
MSTYPEDVTTTSNDDPDAIRREIERTRGQLSRDVDTLTESVRPSSVARRTADRAQGRLAGIRESVMGSAQDAKHGTAGAAQSAADAAHSVADTVGDIPATARRSTQGNPLAAGAVALAAGWLLGSLAPASRKERELAGTAKAKAEPLVDEARSMAKESAQRLEEPARDAAVSVRETAQQAGQNVKDEGRSAAQEVRGTASSG